MAAPTIRERIGAYAESSEGRRYRDSIPAVSFSGRWMTGHWMMGQDYRAKQALYGSYPPRYLPRVLALFPEIPVTRRLFHLFAGAVDPEPPWTRVDISLERQPPPSVYASVTALPFERGCTDLIVADTPYRDQDAVRYGTGKVPHRPKVFAEMARISAPGTHLVWLDIQVPQHRKAEWHWWGAITVLRSTNHLVREAFFFTRR